MKKLFFLILALGLFLGVSAQQAPQYGFNMFNHMAVNPGFAGASDAICVRGILNEQWLGMPASIRPRTGVLSADMAFSKFNSGAGISLVQDKLAYQRSTEFNVSYAYRLKLGGGRLGLGLSLGLLNGNVAGEWVTPSYIENRNENPASDPLIADNKSVTRFDAAVGLFYHTKIDNYNELYGGLSATHLLQPSMSNVEGVNKFKRTYYVTAGYYYTMPNGIIQLRPSVFFKTDGATSQTSVNLTALYNQMFWGGLTYRFNNDIVFMAGVNLKFNLSLGVAYSLVHQEVNTQGTLDLMLKYCFQLDRKKGKSSYRSVRFL